MGVDGEFFFFFWGGGVLSVRGSLLGSYSIGALNQVSYLLSRPLPAVMMMQAISCSPISLPQACAAKCDILSCDRQTLNLQIKGPQVLEIKPRRHTP